jgi:hypothetical protein
MLSVMKNILGAVILISVVASAASAQQGQAGAADQASPDSFVTEKGFRSQVFEVKHRDPNSLFSVLRPLGSGFKGATIVLNREFKTLTMRDFPENIAAVEEALKRLDTPQPAPPSIELRMHVLIASNAPAAAGQYPDELKDVVSQLQSTLNYKSYNLVASMFERTRESPRTFLGSGTALLGAPFAATAKAGVPFNYKVEGVSLSSTPAGVPVVQLNEIYFGLVLSENLAKYPAQIATSVNLRDGEKVVVGSTTVNDNGLILVLSAKVLK